MKNTTATLQGFALAAAQRFQQTLATHAAPPSLMGDVAGIVKGHSAADTLIRVVGARVGEAIGKAVRRSIAETHAPEPLQLVRDIEVDPTNTRPKPAVLPHIPGPSAHLVGWLGTYDRAPDMTAAFESLYTRAAAGENTLPAGAEKLHCLIVPGITGKRPVYFDAGRRALESCGLDVTFAKVTPPSIEKNAAVLRDHIMELTADGRKVMLVGHSWGSPVGAAALQLYPELGARVAGYVSMQGAVGGSPLSQDFALVRNLLIPQMSYDARQRFFAAHPYPGRKVSTVSFVTTYSTPWPSIFGGMNLGLLARYGRLNDGTIIPEDGVLPDSTLVQLNDLDHTATTSPVGPFKKHKDGPLLLALVSLALRQKWPRS